MPTTSMQLFEGDVVKMMLEFLTNRGLNITMMSLEREAGIINGQYSDDMLFLRQLILDGQWDDVIDFVQPLSSVDSFNMKQFQYIIHKHKYLELLCLKSEPGPMQNHEVAVDEVVKCLNTLESLCPTKDEYSNMCLLLTLPKLSDHIDYQNWNPSNARVECFKDIFPIVEKLLPTDKRDKKATELQAKDDRIVQLLIKGILYESCVEFCQHKATSSEYDDKDLKLSHALNTTGFTDADLSLLSWLQAVPHDIFCIPFEQKGLAVDIKPLDKPSLEASWSEQLMVTPIKPKLFPYSAIPGRPRSADIMSRSLNPQYDGLAHGLALGRRDSPGTFADAAAIMSRSYAGGFHLNMGKKNIMQTSVDKLFDDSEMINTHSSSVSGLESSESKTPPKSPLSKNTPPPSPRFATSTPVVKNNRPGTPPQASSPHSSMQNNKNLESKSPAVGSVNSSSDLFKEYQKQRQQLTKKLEEQELQRLAYQRELQELEVKQQKMSIEDNRFIDSTSSDVLDNQRTYQAFALLRCHFDAVMCTVPQFCSSLIVLLRHQFILELASTLVKSECCFRLICVEVSVILGLFCCVACASYFLQSCKLDFACLCVF